MPPVNDAPANAILITLPTSFTYDTTGASTSGGGYPAFESWADVWYRIEPAVDVLIGITVEQTGGPATDGAEVDLYHLTGSDPPTDYNDLDFIDWGGDGTVGPTTGWQDGPTTYQKLIGGEVYYLDCQDWNFTQEIVADVTLTTASPVVNDDWEDAIVIDQVPSNVITVSNVSATGGQMGTAESEDATPSVWYKVVAPDDGFVSLSVIDSSGYRDPLGYRIRIDVYGPFTTPITDLDDLLAGFLDAIQDTGFTAPNNFPISSGRAFGKSGPWYPLILEWGCAAGDEFYVRVGANEGTGRPSEGTLTMRVTLREFTEFDAAPGINGGSSTTSVVDTDWVRDTQYRETDAGTTTYKGALDYTETFEVEPGLAGKYEIHMKTRYTGGTTGGNMSPFVVVVRVNGVPVRTGIPIFDDVNDVAAWVPLTQEYNVQTGGVGEFSSSLYLDNDGGPRWVELAAGDVVSFSCGSDWEYDRHSFDPDSPPDRYIEVQKVRFCSAGAYDPIPSWKTSLVDFEKWRDEDFMAFEIAVHGNKMYAPISVAVVHTVPNAPNEYAFGVWEYELVDGRVQAVNGDLNLGASGGLLDMRLIPKVDFHQFISYAVCTCTDNGDLYLLWHEDGNFGFGADKYFALSKWDGSSWTLISDDVSGHAAIDGNLCNDWWFEHPSIDTDGTDVFIVWGENRTAGDFNYSPASAGYYWRCMKYDVGGNTFTELGTGQGAFQSATSAAPDDGGFDHPARLRISPGGVPWVCWSSFDPDANYEEFMFVWYWDGAAWQDAGPVTHPAVSPSPRGASTYADGSVGNEKGNYIAFVADYPFDYDLVFCHHDGPSETPAVMHQFVYTNQGFSGPGDLSGWWYSECDAPGSWSHSFFAIEAIDFGRDYPQRFVSAISGHDGNQYIPYLGGWTQGMNMDIMDGRPVFFTQKGYFGSGADHVYMGRINSAGDGIELVGDDFPTNAYSPAAGGYSWSDMSQAGRMVDGSAVTYWEDVSAGDGGFRSQFFAVLVVAGGNVSMNWRSSDRRGAANRVLLG